MNKKQEKIVRTLSRQHFTPKQTKCIINLLNDLKDDVMKETFYQTVYLMIALMDITLFSVRGWKVKTIHSFNDSIKAILHEVDDKRMTSDDVIRWAEEMTGINIAEQLELMEQGEENDLSM